MNDNFGAFALILLINIQCMKTTHIQFDAVLKNSTIQELLYLNNDNVLNHSGQKLAYFSGHELFNQQNQVIAKISGNEILNLQGQKLGSIEGGMLMNMQGQEIMSVSGDSPESKLKVAAYFFFM